MEVHSLGAEAHAETGQVAVGKGEEDHEEDVPSVMGKEDGEVITWLNVAQHEEGNEDEPCHHQDRKPDAVFAWLRRKTTNFKTGANASVCRTTGGCYFPAAFKWRILGYYLN